jgi:hypothetical protein
MRLAAKVARRRSGRSEDSAGIDRKMLDLLGRLLQERSGAPVPVPRLEQALAAASPVARPPDPPPTPTVAPSPPSDVARTEGSPFDALERASAERQLRKRQKTVYLSEETCERLRELSYQYRVDQSTIVEQALAEYFRLKRKS